jgi:hypothetical protein
MDAMMKKPWVATLTSAAMLAAAPAAFAQSSGHSQDNQSQNNQTQGSPSQPGSRSRSGQGQDAFRRAETPGRPAVPNADQDYSRAMERLFQAAQRLREAVQALAQQPPGDQRNRAMAAAREALLETQTAMAQTAAIDSSAAGSGSNASGSSGSAVGGGSGGGSSSGSGSRR